MRQNVAGYAVCRITSEAGQTLRLYVGSDACVRIWLNGELVVEAFAMRSAQPDQETTDVRLKAGRTRACRGDYQRAGDCGFYLRLEHTERHGRGDRRRRTDLHAPRGVGQGLRKAGIAMQLQTS